MVLLMSLRLAGCQPSSGLKEGTCLKEIAETDREGCSTFSSGLHMNAHTYTYTIVQRNKNLHPEPDVVSLIMFYIF